MAAVVEPTEIRLSGLLRPPLTHMPYSTESISSETTALGAHNDSTKEKMTLVLDDPRSLLPTRTPSPTPEEAAELARSGVINFRALFRWKTWLRKDWIGWYLLVAFTAASTILVTIYHRQIVEALRPATSWIRSLPAGWTIPIAVLFILSYPPLFGHEIVAILVGLTWGLGPGFGIVAAGTVIGEIGTFYAFRWCCRARGEKLEKTSFFFAELSQVVRDGGFLIALIVRLSAVPGHLTTAVFATCGMPFLTFTLAAILSMPKQFATVYVGVILEQASQKDAPPASPVTTFVKVAVIVLTVLITIFCFWFILRKMRMVKESVIYARRKARQNKIVVRLSMQQAPSTDKVGVLHAPTARRPSLLRHDSSVLSVDGLTRYHDNQSTSDMPYVPTHASNPSDSTLEHREVSEV